MTGPLVALRPREAAPAAREEVLGLLLSCHQRIRNFADLAVRLAREDTFPPGDLLEATQAVHRYFTIALPLHVADEDLSLRPRLLDAPDAQAIASALAAMSLEHVEIEARLGEELIPRWTKLLGDPADRAARVATRGPAERMKELFAKHLENEERSIFPAIDALPESVRQAIAAEIRGRRTGGPK